MHLCSHFPCPLYLFFLAPDVASVVVQQSRLLRAHGSAKWKSRSVGCTLPQNKLDGVMDFLGFPAAGGVFLLLPCPFWAPGPGTMVNRRIRRALVKW